MRSWSASDDVALSNRLIKNHESSRIESNRCSQGLIRKESDRGPSSARLQQPMTAAHVPSNRIPPHLSLH